MKPTDVMFEFENTLNCGGKISDDDPVCRQCGAMHEKLKPNRRVYGLLLFLGGCFAFLTLWVGYNLFFS